MSIGVCVCGGVFLSRSLSLSLSGFVASKRHKRRKALTHRRQRTRRKNDEAGVATVLAELASHFTAGCAKSVNGQRDFPLDDCIDDVFERCFRDIAPRLSMRDHRDRRWHPPKYA